MPEPEPEPGIVTLAPGFDAVSPLGLRGDEAARPRARPTLDVPLFEPPEIVRGAEGAPAAVLADRFERAVRAAIVRAQVYPRSAARRGVVGSARVEVTVGRDGRLRGARLLRSSGSASLDRATRDAVLGASLPAAPTDLAGDSFTFTVELFFGLDED